MITAFVYRHKVRRYRGAGSRKIQRWHWQGIWWSSLIWKFHVPPGCARRWL